MTREEVVSEFNSNATNFLAYRELMDVASNAFIEAFGGDGAEERTGTRYMDTVVALAAAQYAEGDLSQLPELIKSGLFTADEIRAIHSATTFFWINEQRLNALWRQLYDDVETANLSMREVLAKQRKRYGVD